jgi:hypothetical protein
MSVLDVFNQNAFGVVSLTESINLLPYQPGRIGAMGLFGREGIPDVSVLMEEYAGQLALLPTARRGAPASVGTGAKRTMRTLAVPHIPHGDAILASDVQGVRVFGSDDAVQSVTTVVNNRLTSMRQNHEVTLEYHRIGALQGKLLDADGSLIMNLFEEFQVSEKSVDFVLGTDGTEIRLKCLAVARYVEDALGAGSYDHIHAFCGSTWFDKFISHPNVETAYERYQNGAKLRDDVRGGFEFAGIVFEEYRGKMKRLGASTVTGFIPLTQARFFPVGIRGLFKTYDAPADFIEAVNTPGKPVYAKQERMEFDRGIKLHTQSNPLCLCLRPGVLVKGTTSN